MNGVHDMGGMQGYGPVQLEADEPVALEHAAEPTTLSVLTRQLIEAVVHASAKH